MHYNGIVNGAELVGIKITITLIANNHKVKEMFKMFNIQTLTSGTEISSWINFVFDTLRKSLFQFYFPYHKLS